MADKMLPYVNTLNKKLTNKILIKIILNLFNSPTQGALPKIFNEDY